MSVVPTIAFNLIATLIVVCVGTAAGLPSPFCCKAVSCLRATLAFDPSTQERVSFQPAGYQATGKSMMQSSS